jgi:DNA-binding XRE family transcriptional regulator
MTTLTHWASRKPVGTLPRSRFANRTASLVLSCGVDRATRLALAARLSSLGLRRYGTRQDVSLGWRDMVPALFGAEIVASFLASGSDQEGNRSASAQHCTALKARSYCWSASQIAIAPLGERVVSSANDLPVLKVRFVAKGLRSHRDRLGLSADGLGKVLGVSAQSVYYWERGKVRPRPDQIRKLVQLRKVTRRQVIAFLAQQGSAATVNPNAKS